MSPHCVSNEGALISKRRRINFQTLQRCNPSMLSASLMIQTNYGGHNRSAITRICTYVVSIPPVLIRIVQIVDVYMTIVGLVVERVDANAVTTVVAPNHSGRFAKRKECVAVKTVVVSGNAIETPT